MTVMGQHTIAETRDLIAVLNGRTIDLQNAVYQIAQNPDAIAKDPTLQADWAAYMARWTASVANVEQVLNGLSDTNPAVPESVYPVESSFQRIIKTTNPQSPKAYTDKDLMGLQIRIQKLTAIPWQTRPIPSSFDLDFNTYEVADSGVKAVEGAGNAVAGGLASAAKANWKPLVVGALIAGAGVYGAKKVGLL